MHVDIEEILEALRRWQDFDRLHPTGFPPRFHVEAEEDGHPLVLTEHQGTLPLAEALVAQAQGVGLTPAASKTFAINVEDAMQDLGLEDDLAEQAAREALSTAAYMGLIIGLTARDLAEERAERKRVASKG
jgi:hypothetical protein